MPAEEKKIQKKLDTSARDNKNKKRKRAIIIGGLTLLFLLIMIISTYAYAFAQETLPNIYVANVKVSGKNLPDSAQLISNKVQEFYADPIILMAQDKTQEVHAADVGVVVDSKASAALAYDYGRRSGFMASVWDYIRQPFHRVNLELVLTHDQDKLDKVVDKFASAVDKPEINAGVKIEKGKAVETGAEDGSRINRDEVKNKLLASFRNNSNQKLSFELNIVKPTITSGDAKEAISQAEKLRKAKIILNFDGKQSSPSQNTFDSWIGSALYDGKLYASVDSQKIKEWLNSMASDLNQDPVEARLTMTDGKLSIQGSGVEGKSLDEEKTASAIVTHVKDYVVNNSSEKNIVIESAMTVAKPTVTAQNISTLGIVELVGTGTTSFVGSPENRKHNINVGASALSGVIVKPGEEFSTLKNLGKIDQASGYLPELVIKVNKTVPEYGGGLCQVSTTLFRATMNAGLKITERQNHRYRVSYYEPPVGMDATIYEGSPDFKFVNNYTNSILVQSSVIGTKITFEIYGKKDGRTVEVGTPNVYDVVNPPDPIYTDTDTLPVGTTKKIEASHPGASASFNYTVLNADGSVMNKQSFTSKYVPWQAKYLVGTAQPAEATPSPSPSPSPSPTP